MGLFKFISIIYKKQVSKIARFEGISSENTMNKFSTKNNTFGRFSIIKGEYPKGNIPICGFNHNYTRIWKTANSNSLREKTKCKTNRQSKIRPKLRC